MWLVSEIFQPCLFLFCSVSFGHSPLTSAKRSRTSYVYNLADFSQLKLHPYNNQVNNRYVNTVSMWVMFLTLTSQQNFIYPSLRGREASNMFEIKCKVECKPLSEKS